MKLTKLFIGIALASTTGYFAQEETDQNRECDRMRFLAGEELKIKNYAGASMYYLKGEVICGGYDKANYDRMIGSLRNTVSSETDKARNAAYVDTLLAVYDRAEVAGLYDQSNDLPRATYIINQAKADRKKADALFVRGIKNAGTKTHEAYVQYYYYNIYAMYAEVPAEERADIKQRMIKEFFSLNQLMTEANMSVKAMEAVAGYFNAVVKSCDDILPELPGFMQNLPGDVEAKKSTVKNFISLLESKECTDSKEYEMLIDTLIQIDPSFEGVLAKAKLQMAKRKYSDAISTLREARGMTEDADKKEEVDYMILNAQFTSGQYSTAYNSAINMGGKYRGEALKIAGQCVAQNANNCGASTFDRKCNYYYAVDLLERASAAGASVGSLIGKYKANFPTSEEIFNESKSRGQSVSLSCYGVSVTIQ